MYNMARTKVDRFFVIYFNLNFYVPQIDLNFCVLQQHYQHYYVDNIYDDLNCHLICFGILEIPSETIKKENDS